MKSNGFITYEFQLLVEQAAGNNQADVTNYFEPFIFICGIRLLEKRWNIDVLALCTLKICKS